MTQPDKWDEIAEKMTERAESYDVREGWTFEYCAMELATALRSAYAEGERAGMLKAANYAETHNSAPIAAKAIRRAAKETME